MILRQLFDDESSTYTYLVADSETREAVLVDTVETHVDRDLRLVDELGLRLVGVLDTHVHADHVTGAGAIRARTGVKTYVSGKGGAPCADVALEGDDVVEVGRLRLRALSTPGHTNGCMSYVVSNEEGEPTCVFTGDALLIRGCGRTDFQEGDSGALWDSVHEKLFALPAGTIVYPAHDYRGFTSSTIEEERRHNPRLGQAMTRGRFIDVMAKLDLPPPTKIHEAVPANRACGERPA